MTDSVRFRAHYAPIAGKTALLVGTVVVLGLGVALFDPRRRSGLLGMPFADVLVAVAVVAAAVAGLSGFLYLVARWHAWSIGPDGVTGRGRRGRHETIRWESIGDVRQTEHHGKARLLGLPTNIIVTSKRDGQRIEGDMLGVDPREVHAALLRFAGPDHPMTRFFCPPEARDG